jgi:hypothetical protein
LGIQHFMGYGGVSGRPSFPNMDRSVFRAYELCLVQLSFLGGSEPLALALALGAFWMFRRRRIFVAVWLGSLAVTVRPLIIFVLVGIGILYVLPLAIYFGDVLLTVRRYISRDYGAANATGPHGHLFGWPFHGMVVGTMIYPAPWTKLVLSFFRMFAVLAGRGMMFSARFHS